MRRALALAERGRATVSPNPLVGCVIVRDQRVVGEGWHERAGEPHAEVYALRAAGDAARGATCYVTLEPCVHTGETPPCVQALRAAGIGRVVVAAADPNPAAAGGTEVLREVGVSVEVGVLADAAREQNEVFLHGVATGRPFVTAKTAVSLDGRIAAPDGTSQWLTGEAARERAHALRAAADAVLVGSGTVVADDPGLTVRLDGYTGPQPLRVVLDRRRRVTAAQRVVDTSAPTLLVTAATGSSPAPAGRLGGAEVVGSPSASEGLAPGPLLELLWQRGVRSVLVEGGAAVLSSFARAGLVDRLVVHVAPCLLGESGRPALVGPWPTTLADAPRFVTRSAEQVGRDVVVDLVPEKPASSPAVGMER